MSNSIFKVCYKCEERTLGCHSTCEKYKKAVEENEKLKQIIRNEKNFIYLRKRRK